MSQGKQIYYNNLRKNINNMHPRLKELAVKAGAYVDGNNLLTGPMDDAKFAELIVRECADTVLGFHNQFGDSAHNEIREHFGVEQ